MRVIDLRLSNSGTWAAHYELIHTGLTRKRAVGDSSDGDELIVWSMLRAMVALTVLRWVVVWTTLMWGGGSQAPWMQWTTRRYVVRRVMVRMGLMTGAHKRDVGGATM